MKRYKKYSIRRLRAEDDIAGLIEVLVDADDAVCRLAARFALIDIGKRAVPCLVDALKSPNPQARKGAAAALGGIGDRAALEPLADALKDEDASVGWCAAFALAGIGSTGAVGPLINAVLNGDPSVRRASYVSLERVGAREGTGALVGFLTRQKPDLHGVASVAAGEESLPWPLIRALNKIKGGLSDSAARVATWNSEQSLEAPQGA